MRLRNTFGREEDYGRSALHVPFPVCPEPVHDHEPEARTPCWVRVDDRKAPLNLHVTRATPSEPLKVAAPEESTVPVPCPGSVTVIAPFDTENSTDPITELPAKDPLYAPWYEPLYLLVAGVWPNTVDPTAQIATITATYKSAPTRRSMIFISCAPSCDWLTSSFETLETETLLFPEAAQTTSYIESKCGSA